MDTQDHEVEFEILPELQRCLQTISELNLKNLTDSLKTDGMVHGITLCTIDELPQRHFIVDGHTRYQVAKDLELPYKIDRDRILNFGTVAEAVQWICKFQASRRNLTPEQFTLLLGRYYNAEKDKVGANQHSTSKSDQSDPGSSSAERTAKVFGVGSATAKRAGAKTEKLEKLGLDSAVQDATIKRIPAPALDEIVGAVEAEPERKDRIVQEVIEEAKANNGKVKARKRVVTPDPEPDDESDDPERARALEDFTKRISAMIREARMDWDDDFVGQLKRNVLEAFKKPVSEVSEALLPETAPVMPVA